MQPIVVGIAGGSGSGKSTLVTSVRRRLACSSTTLGFDGYYHDQADVPLTVRAEVNYDHPDSLDVVRFVTDLAALRRNEAIEAPVYDFARHTRAAATEIVLPEPVVLVDGILLLAFPEVRAMLDVAVYLRVPQLVRFERRLARDVSERGRSPESVHAQFHDTVAPMHEAFVAPSAEHADLVLSGRDTLTRKTEAVLLLLPEHLSGSRQTARP